MAYRRQNNHRQDQKRRQDYAETRRCPLHENTSSEKYWVAFLGQVAITMPAFAKGALAISYYPAGKRNDHSWEQEKQQVAFLLLRNEAGLRKWRGFRWIICSNSCTLAAFI
jgi:hypothetical protein